MRICRRLATVMRNRPVGARWPSGLDWRPGGPGFESHSGNFASELGNSVYPGLPVSFGGDTVSRWPILSGVYARGSKRPHQSALEMCNLSLTPPLLEKDNSKNNPCV